MTVIVGLVADDGTIYMGGDSAGTYENGDQYVIANPKVFYPKHAPWFVIGISGTLRFGQPLQYQFKPPLPPANVDMLEYMSTTFIASLKKCFRDAGVLAADRHGQDMDHSFLVGYQGALYRVESNFQILKVRDNYIALGSGENFALGAMFATKGQDPQQRIRLALEAAAAYNLTIREPFSLASLPLSQDNHQHVRQAAGRKRQRKRKAVK